ncbi:MAG: Hsp20/alpha crystallin family protein [Candidatus Odinarchaeota archaeon]|nr:Hsp20/alpha crystallin family protein [Candidatus Odinarchaeota archaeon]
MRRYPFRSIIDEIESMRRELNRMLEEVFSEYPEEAERGYLEPMMDVYEDDENFIITMEVPGVEKDEIKIEGYEDYLEVRAKREEMKEMKDKNVVRRERKYSGFYRKIRLPSEVDVSKAKASYRNGILEIRIPKIKKKKSFEIKIE